MHEREPDTGGERGRHDEASDDLRHARECTTARVWKRSSGDRRAELPPGLSLRPVVATPRAAHPERVPSPDKTKSLQCVECGAHTVIAHRWRAYRADVEPGDPPAVAFCCPDCARAELGEQPPRRRRRHTD